MEDLIFASFPPFANLSVHGLFLSHRRDIFQLVGCEGDAEGTCAARETLSGAQQVEVLCVRRSIKALEANRLAPMLAIIRKKFFNNSIFASSGLDLGARYAYKEQNNPTKIKATPQRNTVLSVLLLEIFQMASDRIKNKPILKSNEQSSLSFLVVNLP